MACAEGRHRWVKFVWSAFASSSRRTSRCCCCAKSNGDRYLPIWIGQSEAAAIALEQQGVEPPRPLTHDLIRDLIAALGHSLKEVRIVDLQEGTFYADLIFDRDIKVSARPSDSVAIALRVGVPIYVEEAVLAQAGLLIPDESDEECQHRRSRGRGGEVQGVPRQRVARRLQGDLNAASAVAAPAAGSRLYHGCVSTRTWMSTRLAVSRPVTVGRHTLNMTT